MGRSWRFVLAWLSAAVAAVTVSWLGVRLGVAPAITDEAPVAIDVNRRYTEVRFGAADALPSVTPSTPPPSSSPSRSRRKPSSPATTRPATPRPTPSRPSATPSASPSPTAPDLRPRYRVEAEGGDVIAAYSSTRIDVVGTEPVPGYTVTVTRRSNTLVVVRLAGPSHASAVTLYWNAGPGAQIVEEYGG
ncbi:hypothetical protein GCM10010168_56360 [Actinoplanes ianthinogenes]|uniref:Uncharacterized protein n=1 Tax=Actinoplanes ianthinogenes TaxID=122358 RepID=A0ABM7M313_9ACTN|nr:hypothetical protein [Actinoplanes ianthinogenes]BCJ45944.1 hypothetical protein Aiant_66010 [Actinoplanes ianthinogenes]GGR30983.1 hypothetical protein GCM10010168_56360 [Actinoplanes ianthinogenes]